MRGLPWAAILGLERLKNAFFYFVHRAQAGQLAVGRRVGGARLRPTGVVIDQWAGLLAVYREAVAHGFFAVVVTLHQWFAGDVVLIGRPGRVELSVIATSAGRVYAAPAHAFDDVFFGHHDFHHEIQGNVGVFQCVGLRYGARKTVEQVTVFAIRLQQTITHQTDDDVVGHQATAVHDRSEEHTSELQSLMRISYAV